MVECFEELVFFAGLMHFCQIPAMKFLGSILLSWREEIVKLKEINQAILKTMGQGIMIVVLGMGLMVVICHEQVAGTDPLGRAFCGFLAFFWTHRLCVQIFVYSKIFPKNRLGRLSHLGLSLIFLIKASIFSLVFIARFFV